MVASFVHCFAYLLNLVSMYKMLVDGEVVPVSTAKENASYAGIHVAEGKFGEVKLSHYQSENFTVVFIECGAEKSSTIEFLHDMVLPRLYLVLSGSQSQFIIEGTGLPLKEHQFGLFFSSHGNRAIHLSAGQSCVYLIVQFPTDFLKHMVPAYLPLAAFYVHAITRKKYVGHVFDLTDGMQRELPKVSLIRESNPLELKAKLEPLLRPFLEQAFAEVKRNEENGWGDQGQLAENIRRAAAIIRQRPDVQHSLKSLSLQVGLSEGSLRRGFPKVYHKTISEYLTEIRLEAAVGLLLGTNLTEEAIAIRCGYYGNQSLIKVFKRRFGCTPGLIRST